MKVLVTAFLPFNNSPNNYSMEVLEYIESVEKVVLDVVYDKCYTDLVSKYNLDDYDLIIALGEARMREELTLELQAKNISSCRLADNLGFVKKDEVIDPNYSEVIKTKLDVSMISDMISYSMDAGKFVCNNLYFHLLKNYPLKSLFIHIPNCHDDINEYKKYGIIINEIIKKILERGNKNE